MSALVLRVSRNGDTIFALISLIATAGRDYFSQVTDY